MTKEGIEIPNFSNKNNICDLLNYIKYNSKNYDNKYGFKELNFNIYTKIHNMLSLENIFKILIIENIYISLKDTINVLIKLKK